MCLEPFCRRQAAARLRQPVRQCLHGMDNLLKHKFFSQHNINCKIRGIKTSFFYMLPLYNMTHTHP